MTKLLLSVAALASLASCQGNSVVFNTFSDIGCNDFISTYTTNNAYGCRNNITASTAIGSVVMTVNEGYCTPMVVNGTECVGKDSNSPKLNECFSFGYGTQIESIFVACPN